MSNSGTAAATGPWVDNVYLSTTPTLGAGAIYLGSFTAESSGALAPAARTTARRPSQLPINSSLTAGTYYLVVLADAGGVVNESDLTTQQTSASITLTVPPPPDLSVSSVTSSLDRGAARPVGDGDLDRSRTSAAHRRPAPGPTTSTSRRTASSRDATLLGSVSRSGGLAASGSYTGTLTATLPHEPCRRHVPGHRRDRRRRRRRHRPQSGQQPGQRAPTPDLRPRRSRSVDHLGPGDRNVRHTLTVTWTTTNTGTAPTLSGWVDRRLPFDHQPGDGQLAAAGHGVAIRAARPRPERHGLGERDDPAG